MKTKVSFLLLCLCLTATIALAENPVATCNQNAIITTDTSSGAIQMIAAPAATPGNPIGQSIHVCTVAIRVVQAGTPAAFGLVTGTGTNCATGQKNLTPQWAGTASITEWFIMSYTDKAGPIATPGTAVCFKLSAAPTGSQVQLTYGIY